jgi:glycosyltransferase involved in cell wall biosynthesis
MTETLRITQVVQEFSLQGGIESVAYELHRAWLTDRSVEPFVLAARGSDKAGRVMRVMPWLARIGTRGHWRYVGRLLVVPLFTLAVMRPLRAAQRSGVVLSHGDTFGGDVCVIHAVNRANLASKRARGQWRWLFNPMHLWVELRDRICIGNLRFRRYVAISERIAKELEHYYNVPRSRIAVIPLGVNLARFAPMPDDRAATRSQLGVSPSNLLLLFVGHEFERKGLAAIIGALPALPAATTLLVVGADDPTRYERQANEVGVGNRVIFLGARQDTPRLYRAADVLVSPSAYEAFSLACIEAMASGTPVVATAVGGVEEYVQDGVNGFLVRRDSTEIAAAVNRIQQDSALLDRLRAGALRTASGYGWDVIAQRYRELLRQVLLEREAASRTSCGAALTANLQQGARG